MRFVCDSCRAQYNISDEKVGAKGVKVRCKKCGYVILVRRDVTAETAAPPPPPAEPPPPPAEQEQQAAAQDDGGIPDPDVAMPEDRTIADESMRSPLAGPEAVTDRHAQPKLSGKDETPPPGLAPTNGAGPTSFGGNGANGSPLGGLEDDEIGAVFDQVLQGGSRSTDGEQSDPGSSTLGGFAGNDSTKVISQDALRELAEAGERLGKDSSSNGSQDEASKEEVPETDWYVAVDDEQKGPLTLEKLKDMWERGEVGPDSLCWRAGYSDWTALSEVAALKQVLAPKPSKPQIVAPAMVPVPVEGSFNSGGMAHSFRSEVPMMAASPQAESGGWKPSAASALASLVSEEMSALNKPKQTRSLLESSGPIDMREAKAGGLLDVPDDGPSNGRSPRGGGGGGLLDVPEPSSPGFSRPSPMQGYAAPSSHQSPGASPYPAYTSPAPQRNKSVMIALAAVVVLLLVVVGLGVALVMKPAPAPSEPTKVATAAPAPAPTPTAPPPPQAAAQPAPTPPPPAPAAGSTDSPPMPPPPAGAAPAPTAVAAAPKPIPERRMRSGGARTPKPDQSDEEGDAIVASAPAKGGGGSKGSHDDEFDSLFGGGGSKGGGDEKAPSGGGGSKKRPTVFVPDAPGGGSGGGEVKDSLSTGDVMDVVVSNKGKIVECTKAKPAGTSGKLVVKWTILTSGKATSVQVQTEDLKGSQMANCITALIKGMAFPKHRTQGEPIVFPFTY